jgi:hypothetical protein
MRFCGLALIGAVAGWAMECRAADFASHAAAANPLPQIDRAPPPLVAVVPQPTPNSIFVFAGRMSTTDNWSTMIFNLNGPNRAVYWDNWIAFARNSAGKPAEFFIL